MFYTVQFHSLIFKPDFFHFQTKFVIDVKLTLLNNQNIMDYPGGMYRPPHPQDPQAMPPPPNFQTPGMQREQGINGNLMYRTSQQIPTRMSSGYHPPMNESHNMPAGISVMSGQEQGISPFPSHLPGSGTHRGYHHSAMTSPVNSRTSQNSTRFRHVNADAVSNSNSHSFNPQQHMSSSHSGAPQNPQSRSSFQGHNPDYHPMHHPIGQSHNHSSGATEFNPQDRNHEHQSNMAPPDYHLPLPHNSMMGSYHPHRPTDYSHIDQNLPHQDFPGFVDHPSMNMHGMMGETPSGLIGAGDGYPHPYQLYDQEGRDSEFV